MYIFLHKVSVIPHGLCVFLIVCLAFSGIIGLLQVTWVKAEGYHLLRLKKKSNELFEILMTDCRKNQYIHIFEVFFYSHIHLCVHG